MKNKNALLALSQYETEKIKEVLQNSPKIEKDDLHTLYIVDSQTMERIKKMREEFEKKLKEAKIEYPKTSPYYYVAKLINPEPKDAAVYFNVSSIKRYVYVKDKKSILRNIDKEFEIWKNVERKKAREECKEREEDHCLKIKKRVEEMIKEGEIQKEYIKKNIDKIEVLWTTYKKAKKYLAVFFKTKEGKKRLEHLRKGIPNILLYEQEESKKKDRKVEAFLKDSKQAFGNFYYKKAENK